MKNWTKVTSDWIDRVAITRDKDMDVGVEMYKFLILKVEVDKEIEDCIDFRRYHELMCPKLC
jgi:hypothetical protein